MKILFKNVNTLLYDEKYFVVKRDVLVSDHLIKKIGTVNEYVDRVIDGYGKLLIPGLINAHTHIYMTIFRNIADDLTFDEWLFKRILPLEDHLTKQDSYYASLLGIMEMLSTGTTCFNDMYVYTHATSQAVHEAGIRAILGRGLVGEETYNGTDRRINEALEEMNYWEKKNDLIKFSWAPHAPYTCSPAYLKSIANLSDDHIIHTHLSETEKENNDIMSQYGLRPSEYFMQYGILTPKTILAHCVCLNEKDMKLIKDSGASIVSCPISNLKLGNGIAEIPTLISRGVNVCLGTDGPASNNCLNMFREMQFMSLIHKGVNRNSEVVSASDTFRMATQNGAKAFGYNNLGEIKEGYLADLVLIDLLNPANQPINNLVSALTYSMNGSEVYLTMVNGKILCENGNFLSIDSNKVYQEMELINKRYKELL